MGELNDLGIDIETLRELYDLWCNGATKSSLERDYLRAPQSHGKLFSRLIREHLDIETEKRSSQSDRIAELEREVERLRTILQTHGLNASSSQAHFE